MKANPLKQEGAALERLADRRKIRTMIRKHVTGKPDNPVTRAKAEILDEFSKFVDGRVARYNRKPGGLGK
jgi:hypothetical protein